MVTTPGSIYFLRESDYLTGQISPYVKIGLVRNDKQTSTRISEHQTGNPREIFDQQTYYAPFVEDLETRLHYLYGPRWISGEWFVLEDKELKEVISLAKIYIKRQTKLLPVHCSVLEFAQQVSNGRMRPLDRKTQQVYNAYVALKSEQLIHEGLVELNDTLLKQAMDQCFGIEGVITIQEKNSNPTFDKAVFLNADPSHKQLLDTYLENKPGEGIKGSWSIHHGLKLQNIDPELHTQLKQLQRVKIDIKTLKKKPKVRNSAVEKLHYDLILHKAHLSRLEWELFELELELKVLTAEFEGIEGVCTWKRCLKADKSEINMMAFKAAHPDLYERFLKPGKVTAAMIVLPYRAYPIQF